MINGLYNSASGMNAEMIRQDVIANNLANVNTVGFKKDEAVFTAFPNMLVNRINDRMNGSAPPLAFGATNTSVGVVGHGVQTSGVVTSFKDGTYHATNATFDLALKGDGMFTIELANGEYGYTRSGNFSVDSQGNLVTQAGDYVLGKNHVPVNVDGKEVVIDREGMVYVDGRETEKLLLTQYLDGQFLKRGENVFVKASEDLVSIEGVEPEPEVEVMQGYLEQPNVKVIEEMVDMISVMRAYEANQKSIQIQDETLNKAINEVGRPA